MRHCKHINFQLHAHVHINLRSRTYCMYTCIVPYLFVACCVHLFFFSLMHYLYTCARVVRDEEHANLQTDFTCALSLHHPSKRINVHRGLPTSRFWAHAICLFSPLVATSNAPTSSELFVGTSPPKGWRSNVAFAEGGNWLLVDGRRLVRSGKQV